MTPMRGRPHSKAEEPSYPRPRLRRPTWQGLDGAWDFCMDLDGSQQSLTPERLSWTHKINVPFAPETPASGIGHAGFIRSCWYRRRFDQPRLQADQRAILHFGAVDYQATVWVNGAIVARHEGGYTPFWADISDMLVDGEQTLVVRADDDPADMCKPRGKQDWLSEPHSIWYFRTTGIWQPVWLEIVPATRVESIQWTPNVQDWEIAVEARIAGPLVAGMKLRVELSARGVLLADDQYLCSGDITRRRIALRDGGIDDAREFLFWWPHRPTLIEARVSLLDSSGQVIDQVESHTAMRSASVLRDRFMLNERPYRLEMVLNQGYWPDGGLTAPNDDAFRRDVELIKSLGFNGVRMHQKIEDPRFLNWCDRLGLLVWEEMPSAYAFSPATVRRVTQEWASAIERDISHPCIVAWVPINESWSVPDLPHVAAQRHFVQAIYHLTKSLDPTRPVVGNDGWENLATDIIAIHDYDKNPQALSSRYQDSEENLRKLFEHQRPGGKILLIESMDHRQKPIMLTEFGGIAFSGDEQGTWGYSRAKSAEEFAGQYRALINTVRSLPRLAGYCYTQFTDTYQEANGILTMDRISKFPEPGKANHEKPGRTRPGARQRGPARGSNSKQPR